MASRFEVRLDTQEAYKADVQRDLQGTVWSTGGCSSYYLDENGRNSTGFPWSTLEMRRPLREVDAESYVTEAVRTDADPQDLPARARRRAYRAAARFDVGAL